MALIEVNPIAAADYYGISKLNAEAKHRFPEGCVYRRYPNIQLFQPVYRSEQRIPHQRYAEIIDWKA